MQRLGWIFKKSNFINVSNNAPKYYILHKILNERIGNFIQIIHSKKITGIFHDSDRNSNSHNELIQLISINIKISNVLSIINSSFNKSSITLLNFATKIQFSTDAALFLVEFRTHAFTYYVMNFAALTFLGKLISTI